MVIDFEQTLTKSKEIIGFDGETAEFLVFDKNNKITLEEIDARYSKALWTVVEVLNSRYKDKLEQEFNLYNWIEHNPSDEVSYFLNEASSNCMNYSKYKAVWKFAVYFGSRGFILSVLQQGKGFDSEKIFEERIKSNEGAGFLFYEECSNKVFFDDPKNSKSIYYEYLLK
ncbi:hypothetical protein CL619_04595 [archaeon]|nr:hypothetical protein [archaeon]